MDGQLRPPTLSRLQRGSDQSEVRRQLEARAAEVRRLEGAADAAKREGVAAAAKLARAETETLAQRDAADALRRDLKAGERRAELLEAENTNLREQVTQRASDRFAAASKARGNTAGRSSQGRRCRIRSSGLRRRLRVKPPRKVCAFFLPRARA